MYIEHKYAYLIMFIKATIIVIDLEKPKMIENINYKVEE
jgi:hypothetical protein